MPPPRKCPRFGIFPLSAVQLLGTHLSPRVHFHGYSLITVILTTHYLEEAEALSDRVGIMKDGRLLALGTPEELKRQAGCDRFEDAFIAMVREAGR